jgi:hypothetical protein
VIFWKKRKKERKKLDVTDLYNMPIESPDAGLRNSLLCNV